MKQLLTLALLVAACPAQEPGYVPVWASNVWGYCFDGSVPAAIRPGIERAVWVWEAVIQGSRFVRVEDCRAERTITFRVGSVSPGVAALAAYPPPLVPEPVAGDVTFSDQGRWTAETIYPLALHEVGHALGLVHSRYPDSAMFDPVRVRRPSQADVALANLFYGWMTPR